MNIRDLIPVLLLLSACSSGSSDDGQPVAEISMIRSTIGGEPLQLSSDQIKARLTGKANSADTLLVTGIRSTSGTTFEQTRCGGATCRVGGFRFSISDLDISSGTYQSVMTRSGVSVGQGTIHSPLGDSGSSASQMWGGWLEHNFFFAETDSYRPSGALSRDIAYSISVGNDTGTVPVGGSATWNGVMVAREAMQREFQQGDARLTADFSAMNIDVAFTNIHETRTSSSRADITFNDVEMRAGGFDSGIGTQNMINGKFYGPNHDETGGVFQRGNIMGAFGAKRD